MLQHGITTALPPLICFIIFNYSLVCLLCIHRFSAITFEDTNSVSGSKARMRGEARCFHRNEPLATPTKPNRLGNRMEPPCHHPGTSTKSHQRYSWKPRDQIVDCFYLSASISFFHTPETLVACMTDRSLQALGVSLPRVFSSPQASQAPKA